MLSHAKIQNLSLFAKNEQKIMKVIFSLCYMLLHFDPQNLVAKNAIHWKSDGNCVF